MNLSWLALFANPQSLGHPDSPSPDLIRALNIDRASTVCLGSRAASFWAHVAVAKPMKAQAGKPGQLKSLLKKIKAGLRTMERGGAAVRADYCENRVFGSEAWTMTS